MGSTVPSVDVGTGTFTGFNRHRPPREAAIRVVPAMLERPGLRPHQSLVDLVADRLWGGPSAFRMALLYDVVPAFQAAGGFTFEAAVEHVRTFRRELCHRVFEIVLARHPEVVNPLGTALDPIEFDLDGYQVNIDFMNEGLDFSSNKQVHFDIVEPLGSNLYGPNVNIRGGLPIFSDGHSYCNDRGLRITEILDKISGTRNLTVAPEHYLPLIEDYTVSFDVDMVGDTPFTVFVNRVEEAGLLHGASPVRAVGAQANARRPIGHYAWDNVTADAADQWYEVLGQRPTRTAGDTSADKPLIPAGMRLTREPPVIRLVPARHGGT
jgi:hypothetical protein